ncbi:MAG: hypothetical protein IPF98_22605 [Gemmatimonadetes bacterium]|nr:hypothetical protein [Gemmatimonadota bacterium]
MTGRHLDDVVAVDDRLLTIREHLRRRVRDEHGMVTLGYSVAGGFTWDRGTVSDLRDQQLIETTLRAHGLVDLTADPREMTQVMRGLSGLMRAPTAPLRWRGGGPLRFCVVLEFAEHLVPSQEHTSRTDHEMAAIEVLHLLGHSNALRQSGNLVIVHGREGRVDGLVHEVLHHLRLGPPGEREKLVFLETARRTLPGGRFERGLGDAEVARLTANTPNRGLELLLRASQAAEEPISAGSLIERKSRDVISMSEGTMSLLDVRRILGVKLVGRNIAAVMRILDRFAEGLLQGDVRIPANVLLAGPPSSGKTDCALRVAEARGRLRMRFTAPREGS